LRAYNAAKYDSAGALPPAPLEELTALPRSSTLFWRSLRCDEGGGKGRGTRREDEE